MYTKDVKKNRSTFFDNCLENWGVVMDSHGTIRIKLDELIKQSGISKNKLSHKAEMQRTQINNFCNNKITRLDTDVLARLCSALDCDIADLLEYIPPKTE